MKSTLSKSEGKTSGIYQITNTINGKRYIGSAIKLYQRYHEHRSDLLHNRHHSPRLQHSYNKHGKENFLFSPIELCSRDSLIEREQFWLDFYKSYLPELGYNICKIADSSLGYKHSEETRKKMREIGKRKVTNPKAIKAMQLANTGIKKPEFAKYMSAAFSKPVIQLSLTGEFIREWKSSTEATLSFGAKANDSNIAACTRGKCRSARGFLWVKKEDYNPNKKYSYINDRGKSNSQAVYQYTMDNILVKEWDNANKAAKALGVNSMSIYNCFYGKSKTCKKFKWYRTKL